MDPDILKVVVVLAGLFYFNTRVKVHAIPVNRRIINIGLSLLLFASVMDYVDCFKALESSLLFGRESILHDVLEDQAGDTPGLALLIFGTFREILKRQKKG